MSSHSIDKKIKLAIIKETEELNACVIQWYLDFFPDDLNEFTGCCNEDEINLLIRCYMIYREHNSESLESVDKDFIKALVAYYYMIVVFENYIYNFIGKKYLRIVKEEDSRVPNNKIFTGNDDNIYMYLWTKYDKDDKYIEVEDPVNEISYYVSNTDRRADPYFYKDKKGKIKINVREKNMNCLENILNTRKSKEYYKLFITDDSIWISKIRRIMLNMNVEIFEGFRGGKNKKSQKNKRKSSKKTTIKMQRCKK